MSRQPRVLLVIAFLLAFLSGPQQLFATEVTSYPSASVGVAVDCNEDHLQHAEACCSTASWVSPAHEGAHVLSVSSAEPLPMMVIEAPPLEVSTELYRPPRNA